MPSMSRKPTAMPARPTSRLPNSNCVTSHEPTVKLKMSHKPTVNTECTKSPLPERDCDMWRQPSSLRSRLCPASPLQCWNVQRAGCQIHTVIAQQLPTVFLGNFYHEPTKSILLCRQLPYRQHASAGTLRKHLDANPNILTVVAQRASSTILFTRRRRFFISGWSQP